MGFEPAIGQGVDNRRQFWPKMLWVGMWMAYLGAPLSDLFGGRHTGIADVLGGLGMAAFVLAYLALVFRRTRMETQPPWVYAALAGLTVLSAVLSLTLGRPWLVLFVYAAVGCGAALPSRRSAWTIPAMTGAMVLTGLRVDHDADLWPALLLPCLLGGFAMIGIRRLVITTRQLREARVAVAELAANEERLRLARDLHDLLGHSLSLITLKSELAGRMLPDQPEKAARQVADIEKVSRQALVDVREAVTGYRRPQFAVELAGARAALAAGGIELDAEGAAVPRGLGSEEEGALAWALREAVTNIVRHSGARSCTIALTVTVDGEVCLSVTDDGRGPAEDAAAAARKGNGLSGLEERLALADGRLELGRAARGGFALRAYVPAGAAEAAPAGADAAAGPIGPF